MDMKMKAKALSEEQMDNVAGGTYFDGMQVAYFLENAGYKDLVTCIYLVNTERMCSAIDKLGFEANVNTGLSVSNTYKEKATGKVFSQEEFMGYLKKSFPGVN